MWRGGGRSNKICRLIIPTLALSVHKHPSQSLLYLYMGNKLCVIRGPPTPTPSPRSGSKIRPNNNKLFFFQVQPSEKRKEKKMEIGCNFTKKEKGRCSPRQLLIRRLPTYLYATERRFRVRVRVRRRDFPVSEATRLNAGAAAIEKTFVVNNPIQCIR